MWAIETTTTAIQMVPLHVPLSRVNGVCLTTSGYNYSRSPNSVASAPNHS